MNGKNYRGVLVAILVISLAFLFLSNTGFMTGHAVDAQTTSNVSISKYLSIDASQALQDGIEFGNIATLPVENQNATHNYDGGLDSSQYYINVSLDSNTAVDFCISVDGPLNNTVDTIPLVNESYFYGTTSDINNPAVASEVPFSTTSTKAGAGVAQGTANYYRFWLDVPVSQAVGTYNNTVSFVGINAGDSC